MCSDSFPAAATLAAIRVEQRNDIGQLQHQARPSIESCDAYDPRSRLKPLLQGGL